MTIPGTGRTQPREVSPRVNFSIPESFSLDSMARRMLRRPDAKGSSIRQPSHSSWKGSVKPSAVSLSPATGGLGRLAGDPRRRAHDALGGQLIEGDLLQGTDLCCGQPQFEARAFALGQRARIAARDAAEQHQGLQVVAKGAGMIVIVGP